MERRTSLYLKSLFLVLSFQISFLAIGMDKSTTGPDPRTSGASQALNSNAAENKVAQNNLIIAAAELIDALSNEEPARIHSPLTNLLAAGNTKDIVAELFSHHNVRSCRTLISTIIDLLISNQILTVNEVLIEMVNNASAMGISEAINRGANPNMIYHGEPLLLHAATIHHSNHGAAAELVKQLILAGALVSKKILSNEIVRKRRAVLRLLKSAVNYHSGLMPNDSNNAQPRENDGANNAEMLQISDDKTVMPPSGVFADSTDSDTNGHLETNNNACQNFSHVMPEASSYAPELNTIFDIEEGPRVDFETNMSATYQLPANDNGCVSQPELFPNAFINSLPDLDRQLITALLHGNGDLVHELVSSRRNQLVSLSTNDILYIAIDHPNRAIAVNMLRILFTAGIRLGNFLLSHRDIPHYIFSIIKEAWELRGTKQEYTHK